MELIMEIKVSLEEEIMVSGKDIDIKMINFTGIAYGKYFNGEVIGKGVDTQKIQGDNMWLSARYMLEGKDYTNTPCRIFIENNGANLNQCVPYLITDSEALSYLQKEKLVSKVTGIKGGVLVSIYRLEN